MDNSTQVGGTRHVLGKKQNLETEFFEILLRKAADDLSRVGYTYEKSRTMSNSVFDVDDPVSLLNRESLLIYLADMPSSFTRIDS